MTGTHHKNILILGGARSGKSNFALKLATRAGGKILFCATAEALDDEMKVRIRKHKKSRPQDCDTLEAPRDAGLKLAGLLHGYNVVIIDCITLLVANAMGDSTASKKAEKKVSSEINALLDCMQKSETSIILVSNEVGLGIVPENKLGRIYRDLLGRANQQLAAYSDEVYLMAAGIPLQVK